MWLTPLGPQKVGSVGAWWRRGHSQAVRSDRSQPSAGTPASDERAGSLWTPWAESRGCWPPGLHQAAQGQVWNLSDGDASRLSLGSGPGPEGGSVPSTQGAGDGSPHTPAPSHTPIWVLGRDSGRRTRILEGPQAAGQGRLSSGDVAKPWSGSGTGAPSQGAPNRCSAQPDICFTLSPGPSPSSTSDSSF